MFSERETLWNYLSAVNKPIIMYGMGNGAEKIMNVLEDYNIVPDAFMASDEFVRGQSFLGYKVQKLSEIEETFSDFIILVCFGSSKADIIKKIYNLAKQYEVYAPDVPVVGDGLFDEKYLASNINKLFEVREMFADETSKKVFDSWIDYRLSGKISYLREMTTPLKEAMEIINIRPDGSETFIDLGAYSGDTVDIFLKLTHKNFKKIYAIEPDDRNYRKLRRRNYALGCAKFIPMNVAAWNEDTEIEFSGLGGRNSFAGGFQRVRLIDARSVDSICEDESPTLLKIDVEGAERMALLGAAETILKKHPRIILSLYHRTEDMLELPLLVQHLSAGKYKMYLRHHNSLPAWDTNLYCI